MLRRSVLTYIRILGFLALFIQPDMCGISFALRDRDNVKRGIALIKTAERDMEGFFRDVFMSVSPSVAAEVSKVAPQMLINNWSDAFKLNPFKQATSLFDEGMEKLARSCEGIQAAEDTAIRLHAETFVAICVQVLAKLEDQLDRRLLINKVKHNIKMFKEYASRFVESRINDFEDQLDAMYGYDGVSRK